MISPEWWQYLFLNEGFASYVFIDILSTYYPQQKDYAEYKFFDNSEGAMTEEEQYGGVLPIIPEVSQVGTGTGGLFSLAVYPKAAAVLKMLRDTIGNGTYQAALREYFKNMKLSVATDETLWGYMTQVQALIA